MLARLGLNEAQLFGLRFFLLLIGASILSWAINLPNQLGAPQRLLAAAAAHIATLTGSINRVVGDHIHVGRLVLDINYECTGIYVLLILFAFLLAYPASWKARLAGAAIGVTALTAINVLRIAFLVRVAELQPDLFGYLHEYVWQGVFLVLVIVYAMAWVERVR